MCIAFLLVSTTGGLFLGPVMCLGHGEFLFWARAGNPVRFSPWAIPFAVGCMAAGTLLASFSSSLSWANTWSAPTFGARVSIRSLRGLGSATVLFVCLGLVLMISIGSGAATPVTRSRLLLFPLSPSPPSAAYHCALLAGKLC